MKKILLGLTTTPSSNWREKVQEIVKFNIQEIALFPTFLNFNERQELYQLLEKTCLKSVPHIHLREDMEISELEYLIKKYNIKVLNIHGLKQSLNALNKFNKYKDMIYIENSEKIGETFLKCLKKSAGLCIDFSHWENYIIQKEKTYDNFEEIVKESKIGCCHISAIKKKLVEIVYINQKVMVYTDHHLDELSELDYLKKYIKYLPGLISIELENSFKEQFEAKKYLEQMISNA